MKLDGRRKSTNVEDRRGMSGKSIGIGGGIIGVIVAAIITLLSGGDVSDVVSNVANQMQNVSTGNANYVETPEDARLADLTEKVLAGTEDVWTKIFREQGWGEYEAPGLVIYSGTTNSGCGHATSQIGPFYCSADQKVYIDLDFFKNMQQQIGASGDFAYAYVIAHEVGHHVQFLRGTLTQAHQKMSRLSEAESNKISVRLELQADFYAGVWANYDNKMFGSIEPGDVENAVNAALKIGDDYLQKQAYGYEVPEKFNHGRSEQRKRWLLKGINNGDVNQGDTFAPSYSSL